MTVSFESRLTPLQQDVLRAFFERERGFFLTGGAALAGFYLGHRETDDLDFFTASEEAFERGRHALAAAAEAVGGRIATRRDAPGYQRFVVSRGDEGVVNCRSPTAPSFRPACRPRRCAPSSQT